MIHKESKPLWLGILWLCAIGGIFVFLYPYKAEADWFRTAGFFIAGVGVAPLGLFLAHQRTAALWRQTQNESARRVTDAFTKAVELLGHKDIAVRQGGIHALSRIAQENSKEHPKIIRIIAAYIRHRGQNYISAKVKEWADSSDDGPLPPGVEKWDHDSVEKWILPKAPMPVDLEAAIAAIRERTQDFDPRSKFHGILRRSGRFIDLSNTRFFNADFTRASLSHANLSGCKFYRCEFTAATLNGAQLQNTDFVNSVLRSADLSECFMLKTMIINSDCQKAKFQRVCFDGGGGFFDGFSEFNGNFRDADFSDTIMRGVKFRSSSVFGAKFDGTILIGADLSGCHDLWQGQLKAAIGNKTTKLPENVNAKPPAEWKQFS